MYLLLKKVIKHLPIYLYLTNYRVSTLFNSYNRFLIYTNFDIYLSLKTTVKPKPSGQIYVMKIFNNIGIVVLQAVVSVLCIY